MGRGRCREHRSRPPNYRSRRNGGHRLPPGVDSFPCVMVFLTDRQQLDHGLRMVEVQLVGFEFDAMTGPRVYEHH